MEETLAWVQVECYGKKSDVSELTSLVVFSKWKKGGHLAVGLQFTSLARTNTEAFVSITPVARIWCVLGLGLFCFSFEEGAALIIFFKRKKTKTPLV